jgi:hypothetical protein
MVKQAFRRAVHVRRVFNDTSSKPIEVEVRIRRYEWIERPEYFSDPFSVELCALVFFEATPNANVSGAFPDAKSVRPVDQLAALDSRQAENKTEQISTAVEGAGSNSAHISRDLQNRRWNSFFVFRAPDFEL